MLSVGLVAIAGVVTPLGLYEGYTTPRDTDSTFQYVQDPGPCGYAVSRSHFVGEGLERGR